MERRNRSLKALEEFKYLDSLEGEEKAQRIQAWVLKYITNTPIEEFDLTVKELKTLEELFFKNINFLKKHQESLKKELNENKKIKEFLNH